MNILYIVLLFITLYVSIKILYYSNDKNILYEFNTKRTLPLRGLLAILIILHHLAQAVSSQKLPIINEFMSWGGIVVGIFFFITGYGLMASYMKKGKDYLNGFLKRRLGKILPSFFIAVIVYLCIQSYITRSNAFLTLYEIRYGYTPLPSSWFVYAIVLYYIAFYFFAKFISRHTHIILCLWFFSIIYIVTLIILKWEDCWYKSILAFNFGFTYSYYESEVRAFILQKPKQFISFLYSLLIFIFAIRYLNTFVLTNIPIWKSIIYYATPFFSIITIYIIKGKASPIFNLLGEISYEIYIVQGVFVIKLLAFKDNWILYFISTYTLSIITAYLLHKLIKRVNQRIHFNF